jgi:MSHA biogenesis protein MshM
MLCRMLLEKLPENVETVYLANPSCRATKSSTPSPTNCSMPAARRHDAHHRCCARCRSAARIYAAGRQVVVLIDEAHAMPAETLEEIRLLSNLESNRHKLLQIVLFGQPELDNACAPTCASSRSASRTTFGWSRCATTFGSYLMFRMRAAGYHGPDLFSQPAPSS